ncbi:NADPH_oxidoreductase [Hexamita inflata]|uniref:NADPH oxidoreductase n=1 Tax=Hexamita inflata TaxID=28002 RepID=A0AA86VIY4_9EUKA|nr:NADPH oxidoreductase [Hexamita inflata]
MKTIIVLFHPNPENSIRNRQIQEQVQQLHNVTYHTISSTTIDSVSEQALLKQFDRIVFQYPIYWYNLPGCGQLYLDAVLDKNLFKNKKLKIIATTAAPRIVYKNKRNLLKFWE